MALLILAGVVIGLSSYYRASELRAADKASIARLESEQTDLHSRLAAVKAMPLPPIIHEVWDTVLQRARLYPHVTVKASENLAPTPTLSWWATATGTRDEILSLINYIANNDKVLLYSYVQKDKQASAVFYVPGREAGLQGDS